MVLKLLFQIRVHKGGHAEVQGTSDMFSRAFYYVPASGSVHVAEPQLDGSCFVLFADSRL